MEEGRAERRGVPDALDVDHGAGQIAEVVQVADDHLGAVVPPAGGARVVATHQAADRVTELEQLARGRRAGAPVRGRDQDAGLHRVTASRTVSTRPEAAS